MFPDRTTATSELELAGRLNPGAWTQHSINVARAAELIAQACHMDSEKAYICGLLHDIGRRTGVCAVRHVIDGYDYCTRKGWCEVARICLTHSYPTKDIDAEIGKFDISKKQYDFIKEYLQRTEYDDFDRLIILCDALATANGFCILEKRFVDTTMRYGAFPFTVDRWQKTYEFKQYFESLAEKSIYRLLPGIEQCIYD